jgi:glucose-6-phosphate 1-dehydrogenase
VSGEEVELAWQFITPILKKFKELPLHTYVHGSTGPEIGN